MGEYHNTQLGKETQYQNQYDPTLLFPIDRASARSGEVPKAFEFFGNDAWTAYELSWLNLSGKPVVAVARFKFPCNSKYVIESKSFKLYLNSLIQSKFASKFDVIDRLASDLSRCCGEAITIDIYDFKEYEEAFKIREPAGTCIDSLDIEVTQYEPSKSLIEFDSTTQISELLYSHLLKTNCPVTNQPDWASVYIDYSGPKISMDSLLRYIISYRLHQDFHEVCVEKIFYDLYTVVNPSKLTVFAKYTRRGGLDISPCRSTELEPELRKMRQVRQ